MFCIREYGIWFIISFPVHKYYQQDTCRWICTRAKVTNMLDWLSATLWHQKSNFLPNNLIDISYKTNYNSCSTYQSSIPSSISNCSLSSEVYFKAFISQQCTSITNGDDDTSSMNFASSNSQNNYTTDSTPPKLNLQRLRSTKRFDSPGYFTCGDSGRKSDIRRTFIFPSCF